MRNKLLNLPPVIDPRCTGRTTGLALDAITRAMRSPGSVVYVTDHFNPGTYTAGAEMLRKVNECIAALKLEYYSVTLLATTGQYNHHVRIVSDIWEK